jgi:hypothetical protein
MKITTSVLLTTAVIFAAGCQQGSNSSGNAPDTNSAASEAETNAINTMNDVKSNVVETATNAYMSATNAVLTNSSGPNNP